MNKQDVIYYLTGELESMGMKLKLHENIENRASFLYNKYDRRRAHIQLNPNYFSESEFIAVALHELGHAKLYHKYSTMGYRRQTLEWHELGAWNIALRHAESLSLKLDGDFIRKCLKAYDIGDSQVEGMLSKWKHCLYSRLFV